MFGLFKRKEKYLSDTEYWVYIPTAELPNQEAMMDFVIRGHADSGHSSTIGPKEGILFSDIRLTIALVLRSKNPHVFRPDLIGEEVRTTKELLECLADSVALIKIRYISEEPLPDNRHLRMLPNLVVAAGTLGNACAVYDAQQETLSTFANFVSELRRNPDPARPDFHVRSLWKPLSSGGQAESRGLAKVGLRDFATKGMNADEQVLVTNVVEEAARQVFATARFPESVVIESFNDRFRVVFDQKSKGTVTAVILRMHESAV